MQAREPVIANIWNGSSDKRNICTTLREEQTEEQMNEEEAERKERWRKERERERRSRGSGVSHFTLQYVMRLNVHATGLREDISQDSDSFSAECPS